MEPFSPTYAYAAMEGVRQVNLCLWNSERGKWLTGASAALHSGRCDSLKGRSGGGICEVCPLGKASMLVVDEAKVLDIP